MAKSPQTRYLAHLSSPQIEALDKQTGVVILPIGAVEQHGPHMPTLTDSLIISHLTDAVMAALPDEVRAWALPPMNYGKSNEHINFVGTVTLTSATLIAVLHDIAASIARAGFRRLAFFNGHGGNMALLQMVARDIRVEMGLMCFCLQPGVGGKPPFEITPDEQQYGMHAGEIETSMILAIDPELVDMEKAVKHFAYFPETGTALSYHGSASTAWLADDWSPTGVFGDATLATVEKGQAIMESYTERLVAIITAISTFEVGKDRS